MGDGDYGYHKKQITKGKLGELSKIREELEELEDAQEQCNQIMSLCELSDIYGALRAYLKNYFPDFGMYDLEKMADATERAFKVGHRK